MTSERLQKLISASGLCSRRKAELLLIQQLVSVNGEIAKIGDKADLEKDKVYVRGIEINNQANIKIIIVNKPIGVISSCKDEYGRNTVLDLLPKPLSKGLHLIGRLDSDSRGAILLTNHGKLTLHLTHPRYSHMKKYKVWIEGNPSDNTLQRWEDGVLLEQKMTRKALIRVIKRSKSKSLLEIEMKEGRNRQIKRIGFLLGHRVLDLQRTEISGVSIVGLNEGEWRYLNPNETNKLLESINFIKA